MVSVAKSIGDIETDNRRAGEFFFSPGAMKGFRSIVYPETFDAGAEVTLFVSSEKPPYAPRDFTIQISHANGRIDKLDRRGAFRTKAKAVKVATQVALWWRTDTGPEGEALDTWLAEQSN
jgi:hypothetical protein